MKKRSTSYKYQNTISLIGNFKDANCNPPSYFKTCGQYYRKGEVKKIICFAKKLLRNIHDMHTETWDMSHVQRQTRCTTKTNMSLERNKYNRKHSQESKIIFLITL